MTDMNEEREEKMKRIRAKVNQLRERAQSVKPLEEINLDTEELDEEIRERIRTILKVWQMGRELL